MFGDIVGRGLCGTLSFCIFHNKVKNLPPFTVFLPHLKPLYPVSSFVCVSVCVCVCVCVSECVCVCVWRCWRYVSQAFRLVQFKMVSMRSEKPAHSALHPAVSHLYLPNVAFEIIIIIIIIIMYVYYALIIALSARILWLTELEYRGEADKTASESVKL